MRKLISVVLVLLPFSVFGYQVFGNELSSVKKATESEEYERLKEQYRECVIKKGKLFLNVSPVQHAIEHAPIACYREFLGVRQFLLSGAFKVEVIDQLMESVKQGVQIDLVNAVYDEALRKKGIIK